MKDRQQDLDFQIKFYERILQEKPDYIDALIALGDAYTKKGLYQKGLDVDKKLSKLKKDDPIVHYNLACSYSLLKYINKALKSLHKAIQLGYNDLSYIEKDPDLANARKDLRFTEIVENLKNKLYRKENSAR